MEASQYKTPGTQALYGRYAGMLYRLAYAVLRTQQDAEDAVAEVFVKWITKHPVFRDAEHERAWFVRVCVNQCRDFQRRRKIRVYTPLEQVSEALADIPPDTAGVLEDVLALPEKYKMVILLYYFEDFSVGEIAASLGTSVSAVKMRLSRARQLLRRNMEGNYEDV